VTADDIIELLGLEPHPEGGHFRQTWRAPAAPDSRPAGTAIYFLLRADEVSHWHRVDAAEAWHHYIGASIELAMAPDACGPVERHVLGHDLAGGERPQVLVPAGVWQSARPLGGWALVGCTVAPGFDFAGFELAPPGWSPDSVERTDPPR
jgi:hypothetical protein